MTDTERPALTTRVEEDRVVAVLEDGTVAGQAHFRRDGSTYVFDHTVVEPAHEGEGVGSRLAEAAMGLVRGEGARVVPTCSFIHAYMGRHPETHDLLAEGVDLG